MIKYKVKCHNSHEFESWFSNSNEYEKLKRKKLIECIFCGSQNVEKSIMSPRVINSNSNIKNINNEKEFVKIKKDLLKIRKFVEKNFEYVGDKFTRKVRDIYFSNKGNKNIYGTTTQEQREELKEDGIELTTIPWVEKDD